MFEFLMVLLFLWLGFKVLGLVLRLAWGTAKLLAGLLMVLAVPLLFVTVLFVGGLALLLPLGLLGLAFAIAC